MSAETRRVFEEALQRGLDRAAKLEAFAKGMNAAIKGELADGAEATWLANLLVAELPGLIDRRAAQVAVMAAFDAANRDSDRAMPFATGDLNTPKR